MIKPIEAALRTAVYGSMAAAAGVAAFFFLVIAAFLWTQQHYDTIVACGVGAGFFLLVALGALAMLAISRRRAAKAKQEAANSVPAWLADPAMLLTAAQLRGRFADRPRPHEQAPDARRRNQACRLKRGRFIDSRRGISVSIGTKRRAAPRTKNPE